MAELKAGKRTREPTHPGVMAATTLADLDVSGRQCALAIGITPQAIGPILKGKSPVTANIALRFGCYFGNGPELWINMQSDYDLWHVGQQLDAELRKIKPAKKDAA